MLPFSIRKQNWNDTKTKTTLKQHKREGVCVSKEKNSNFSRATVAWNVHSDTIVASSEKKVNEYNEIKRSEPKSQE